MTEGAQEVDGAGEVDGVDERTIRVRRPSPAALDGLTASRRPGADAEPDERTLRGSRARRTEAPDDATLRIDRGAVPRHPAVVSAAPAPEVAAPPESLLPPPPEPAHLTPNALAVQSGGRSAPGEQPVVDGAAIEGAVRRTALRRALVVLIVGVAVVAASVTLLVVLLAVP